MRKFLTRFILALFLVFAAFITFTYQPLFFAGAPSAPVKVDEAQLRQHVHQLSVSFYPRSFDFPNNLNASADYIKQQWQDAGIPVKEQTFIVNGTPYRNLIAEFGPPPDKQHPVTIIGAHYDSYGNIAKGAQFPSGFSPSSHTPGADDNASGVAGLIELGKQLTQTPPQKPITLVAYTLEEPPNYARNTMGSAVHAQSIHMSAQPVELMISLEMIGYFTDAPNSQDYPIAGMGLIYPTTGNFISLISRFSDWQATRKLKASMQQTTTLPVYSINTTPLIKGVDFSDHRNYWTYDYPAIMVTDTSFMRNKAYHHEDDTEDRLDFSRMAQVVQGVYAFAMQP